ncbi:hypothetical protein GKE82_15245 [Conexibacter sp. W3-3-2]|uniref:Integral membrane protein n=1 Tax=Paraconexibacter algicola TaxID=2133960 RepID=A0A2T4UJ67_9ACTN|nr:MULTISPECIES: hypothetical protein [Solirubrobacterales]MTD45604.1 hypothetical protein [Conexibacter sp. W3-3-2]PTL59272.1 hypothetical protein C7Y72_06210 [Paraconexibacter algicola]
MDLVIGRSRSAAARRRREVAERRTRAIAAAAGVTTGAVLVAEVLRVWRRGDAPLPGETEDVVLAAEQAIGQTVEVAVAGYKGGSTRENALLNLHLSFLATFVLTRVSTRLLRERGRWGPLRNVVVGDHHIHHFVPGIAMAFLAGGVSIVSRDEDLDPYLAVPFGAGVALTLDESALLLKLDDVYWSEEGIVSVQITLATLAMLSALALALRVLRRGEAEVLEHDHEIGHGMPGMVVPVPSFP